jgi:hypothetical protein
MLSRFAKGLKDAPGKTDAFGFDTVLKGLLFNRTQRNRDADQFLDGQRRNNCEDAVERMDQVISHPNEEIEPILAGAGDMTFVGEDAYEGMLGMDPWHDLGGEG